MVTHDHGNTFKVIREALTLNGYYIKWKVMNSKNYGDIPQNRERIYIVGFLSKNAFDKFKFPEEIELKKTLKDVIDFDTLEEEKYYYRKGVQPFYDKLAEDVSSQESVYQWRRQYVRENKNGVVPTLTANMGTGGHNVPIIFTKNGIRKLTPRETFNVQGFPKDFKLPNISNGQLYKQAGNSVVVPLIKRIANRIANALEFDIVEEKSTLDNKDVLIYVNKKSRYEGESYFIDNINNMEEIDKLVEKTSIPVISDEEYFKIIKTDKNLEFYSICHTN